MGLVRLALSAADIDHFMAGFDQVGHQVSPNVPGSADDNYLMLTLLEIMHQ
jgi:hypothetical protein